jgi:hypothetical protein
VLEEFLAPARATIARDAWDAELAAGRTLTQQGSARASVLNRPGRRHARLTKAAPEGWQQERRQHLLRRSRRDIRPPN